MAGAWRLRGYVVESLIGRGSSGEVWRARVAATGDPVALKRLVVRDADQARGADAEAALLTALDHPHLVRLHAVVPADGASVLVLDLAEGGSLAELLAARGRLAPGEVITAVAPVAAGLAYLHDQGVVHGDVSAANILFTPGGSPLLADVGVARLTGDDRDAASTPAYVDPAVAAGCVPGPPSDVFMLAAVALHALTGAPVWDAGGGEAALALAAQGVLNDVAERLSAAGVPAGMSTVLCRALAVDPHRRGTAADLALDLRHSGEPVAVELAAGRAPAGSSGSPPPPGPRHAAQPAGARRTSAGRAPADERSRPPFERPAGVAAPTAGASPPTRLVGPRPRPAIPRSRPRGGRRRAVLIALALALTALLAAAGTVWATTGGHPARNPSAGQRPAAAASHPRSSRAAPPSSPAPPPPRRSAAPAPTTAATNAWRAALPALDAIRARAFLTRDARLLARVYLPGPLLAADTATLRRIVPAGCGLFGVRTTYRAVQVTRHGEHLTVTATATLSASRLICAGRVTGTAPGTGPVRLRVILAPTASGLRIAELHS